MSSVNLVLPLPPSVNSYWRHATVRTPGGLRLKVYVSAQGMQYRNAVAKLAFLNAINPMRESLFLHVVIYRKQKRGDIDNFLKALLDSLNGKAYVDDSQIRCLHVDLKDDAARPRVELTWSKMENSK